MDSFKEQIVVKETTLGDMFKKGGIIVASLLLAAVLFLAAMIFGLTAVGIILALAVLYGGYYLFTGIDAEYEYILTNGELDIDKIIARRKRKRLLTVKVSAFEEFDIITNAPEKDGLTVFMVTGRGESDYFADFKHSKHGDCRLIFSPDEKMREAIEPYLRINK